MRITIKYFGQIAELTQSDEDILEFSGGLVSDMLEILNVKYPQLKERNFRVAQNQELVSLETKLTGAELALLPPFSGG